MKDQRRHHFKRYFLTGLFVLVPAWGTFLILRTLFTTLDGLVGDMIHRSAGVDIPGLGVIALLGLILITGIVVTHFASRLYREAEEWVGRIPFVRSIYLTIKSMTDIFQFRARFDKSTVVVFPFPRDGLWALGFVMGMAPPQLQVAPEGSLAMIFVPTAIHPFTGYLAFIPQGRIIPINLAPEEAVKVEFSAGLYKPEGAWLKRVPNKDVSHA